ncbi:unnamed protein product [Chrysodeixis includens]|uniref:Uncharacterized protein n=1 Tax=Chrysodeixis includens TaxID=689277 RepID=A0A9N8KS85_CHRIL|nr:unnamed protein product [Chrysodeixis includens]
MWCSNCCTLSKMVLHPKHMYEWSQFVRMILIFGSPSFTNTPLTIGTSVSITSILNFFIASFFIGLGTIVTTLFVLATSMLCSFLSIMFTIQGISSFPRLFRYSSMFAVLFRNSKSESELYSESGKGWTTILFSDVFFNFSCTEDSSQSCEQRALT